VHILFVIPLLPNLASLYSTYKDNMGTMNPTTVIVSVISPIIKEAIYQKSRNVLSEFKYNAKN
jgi:hypothetical protein